MHQVQEADLRANAERNGRAMLEEKQTRLIQSYNDLKNFHQTARHEYESLELASKRLNSTKAEEIRKPEFAEHMLMCEKYTRDQAEKNFGELLASMKILAANFHILINEKSQIPENEKVTEHQLDYANLFTEKEAPRHERNKLLLELMEREKTISSLRNQLLHHA